MKDTCAAKRAGERPALEIVLMVMTTVLLAALLVFLFTTVLTVAGVGAAFIIIPTFYWLGIPLTEAMAVALLLNAHQHELRVLQLYPLPAGQLQDRNTHYHPCGYLLSPRRLLHEILSEEHAHPHFCALSHLRRVNDALLHSKRRKMEEHLRARN